MLKSGLSAFLKNRKSGSTNKILINVPSEIKYIKKVSSGVLASLKAHNVRDDKAFEIKLCLEEAVRNAIVHGNHSDRKLSVRISYKIDGGRIEIDVEDEGKGFDHKALPDPTKSDNLMKNCGRGVYIIKKMMDKAEFNETGNKLTMTKNLK